MPKDVLTTTRGFTLIEALIALTVLLLAVLAMFSVMPFGFSGALTNSIHVQAVATAQQYLEDERDALLNANTVAMPSATTAPIDPGQSFVSTGAAAGSYGTFTVVPDGCSTVIYGSVGNGNVGVYSCSVTVSWTQGGASHSVSVQSYVTGQ
jgi:type II secretory pathway pseudopilin PulG